MSDVVLGVRFLIPTRDAPTKPTLLDIVDRLKDFVLAAGVEIEMRWVMYEAKLENGSTIIVVEAFSNEFVSAYWPGYTERERFLAFVSGLGAFIQGNWPNTQPESGNIVFPHQVRVLLEAKSHPEDALERIARSALWGRLKKAKRWSWVLPNPDQINGMAICEPVRIFTIVSEKQGITTGLERGVLLYFNRDRLLLVASLLNAVGVELPQQFLIKDAGGAIGSYPLIP